MLEIPVTRMCIVYDKVCLKITSYLENKIKKNYLIIKLKLKICFEIITKYV